MTRPVRQKESWSLRLYAWLLELYPPAFVHRHRAEMLQNFADLEDAEPSKAKLWLLIGKDLTMSLILQFFGSRLGRYVISVLVAWLLIFTVGYFRRDSTPGYPLLHVFGGFLPGMLVHVYRDASSRNAAEQVANHICDRHPWRGRRFCVDIALPDRVFPRWRHGRRTKSGFASLRRLSDRHAVDVHRDACLRHAAKQLTRLDGQMVPHKSGPVSTPTPPSIGMTAPVT